VAVIEVAHQGGVALVTLNRPDANNALNRDLSEGIIEIFSALAADDGVKAIVLTWRGPLFLRRRRSQGPDRGAGAPVHGHGVRSRVSACCGTGAMPAAHYWRS
jgi:hypothetical protein